MALNDKQRAFCAHLVEGMSQTAAYVKAYGCKEETARRLASRLMTNDGVSAEIKRLRDIMDGQHCLRLLEKRRMLADIARDKESASPSDRMKAIEIDNKMTGQNAPEKLEVTGAEGGAIEFYTKTSPQMEEFVEKLAAVQKKLG